MTTNCPAKAQSVGGVAVGGISAAGRDYVQDERYFAMEHMDVRRDFVSYAHALEQSPRDASPTSAWSLG